MFKLDQIARAGLSRIDTIRVVRTAVNPLLWQAGLTTPLFLLAAILIDDRLVEQDHGGANENPSSGL